MSIEQLSKTPAPRREQKEQPIPELSWVSRTVNEYNLWVPEWPKEEGDGQETRPFGLSNTTWPWLPAVLQISKTEFQPVALIGGGEDQPTIIQLASANILTFEEAQEEALRILQRKEPAIYDWLLKKMGTKKPAANDLAA
ncbi:hypothetical protein KGQ71_03440 [Patescibacteria group bacterium]|nr:hypothetical protein [Patescibacteria group bacterium]